MRPARACAGTIVVAVLLLVPAVRAESPDAWADAAAAPVNPVARTIQSMNPDLSIIATVALAVFSDDQPLLSGAHDPASSGFNLQGVELVLSAAVDPYFRLDATFVFSTEEVEVEEIYATTLALPWSLQLRAGQFLTRFGRVNGAHPHSRDFVDQVLVLGKFFGGEGSRGLGLELSALLPLPWSVELALSVTNAAGGESARSFFGDAEASIEGPADLLYVSSARQFFPLSDDWSLLWGLSWATGPSAPGQQTRTNLLGTDLFLKYRPITRGSYTAVWLQAEGMLRWRKLGLQLLQDWGMYATAGWRLARRWSVTARYERVSGVAQDPLDPAWTSARQRVSACLSFRPTEFSRLRLQYGYDLPGWRRGYHAVVLSLEVAAGAHGAHKF